MLLLAQPWFVFFPLCLFLKFLKRGSKCRDDLPLFRLRIALFVQSPARTEGLCTVHACTKIAVNVTKKKQKIYIL